jgi:hypothetical protein
MTDTNTDYVSILVPKERLMEVYGFIASLDGGAELPSSGDAVEKGTDWTDELIERQFNESPEFMQRFQKFLAEEPEQWFSTKTIAKRLNALKGSKTVAGALGAYGRRTSHRYAMKTWPFQYRWNHSEEQMHYSMDKRTAEIIRGL